MDFDCCTNTQMCLLFIFNFLIWVLSAACIAVGIWALVDANFINTVDSISSTGLAGVSASTVQAAAVLLIIVGVITFMIAFCGCCGAMKRSKCLLRIYIVAMLILLILQIAAVVLAFIFSGTINSVSNDVFLYWVKREVREKNATSNNDKYAARVVHYNQFTKQCCGSLNGTLDYNLSRFHNDTKRRCLVPESCCVQAEGADVDNYKVLNRDRCCKSEPNFTYMTGCKVTFESLLMFPFWLFYVVGICFIVVQIVVTIFACVVHNAIDELE